MGEQALLHAGHEDHGKFESLGIVERHQRDRIRAAPPAFGGYLLFRVGDERHLVQERRKRSIAVLLLKILGRGQQLGQVFQADARLHGLFLLKRLSVP